MIIHITCSDVIFVVFPHLEWDCRHHQVESVELVVQTFHNSQDTTADGSIMKINEIVFSKVDIFFTEKYEVP